MSQMILAEIIALVFAGISAVLAFCVKHFNKEMKKYKNLLAEQKQEGLRNTIHEEIEPLVEEIHRLQDRIAACEHKERDDMSIILGSYKFRLIYLCRTYLRQGHLSQDQFDQLSEFYKVYHGLGGNGQAQEYYEKVMELPIK